MLCVCVYLYVYMCVYVALTLLFCVCVCVLCVCVCVLYVALSLRVYRRGAGTSSSRRYVKGICYGVVALVFSSFGVAGVLGLRCIYTDCNTTITGTSITPCVAYTAKGYCPALNRQCPYFHEGIDCNRFVRGDCFFGSRCKFRHRPALRESESAERPHQPHQTHIRNKAVTNQRVVVINQDSSLSVSNRTALSSDHESSGKEASLSTTVTSFPQIEFTGIPDDITDSRSLHPSKSSDDTPSAGHVQSEKLSISMQVDPSTVMSTELEEGERQESAPHINLAHNMSDDVVSNDASAGGTSSKKYFQQKSELKLRDNVPPYNHRSDHAAQEQPQLLRSASRHRNVDYRVRESYRRREYPPKQYPTHRSRRSNEYTYNIYVSKCAFTIITTCLCFAVE